MQNLDKKSRLGKGISAIIPNLDDEDEITKNDLDKIVEIDLNKIVPNKFQPRKEFSEEELDNLANSIKENGLLQPIIVRKIGEIYEIIAGERRFKAFEKLGLPTIKAIIKEDLTDEKMLEYALIENIQRENLSPIEEAYAYKRLQDEFDLMQEDIAIKVGKSRSTIANTLRLLKLDEKVQQIILKEKIGSGIAKLLLTIENNEVQLEILQKALEKKLTVKEIKNLIDMRKNSQKNEKKLKIKEQNIHIKKIEEELRYKFDTEIIIKHNELKSNGKIEIYYYDSEDFERILEKLKGE